MLRSEIVNRAIDAIRGHGKEFKPDDVVEKAFELYPDELAELSSLLARNQLRRDICNQLKKISGDDTSGGMDQITIDGLGRVPRFIQFVNNGDRGTSFIDILDARLPHFESHVDLKIRNHKYTRERLDEGKKMLDYVRHITAGDRDVMLRDAMAATSLPEVVRCELPTR